MSHHSIQLVQRAIAVRSFAFDPSRFLPQISFPKAIIERLEPRYFLSSAQLDPTFGAGGTALFNPSGYHEDFAFHLAVQSDGKIVTTDTADYDQSRIIRANVDGSLDTSFGTDGLATFKFGTGMEGVNNLAVDSRGRIVFVGTAQSGEFTDSYVGRLNPDGSLDTTFGDNGIVQFNFVDNQRGSDTATLSLTTDGKIIVVGQTFLDDGNGQLGIARFYSDGSFDTTFANSGREELTLPDGNSDHAVALQPDGKILIAGESDTEDSSGAESSTAQAVRLNTDGSLDSTFGTGGVVNFEAGRGFSTIGLTTGGKIVLGTYNGVAGLAELNADGSINTGFGINGLASLNTNSQSSVTLTDLVVESDGKILTVGTNTLQTATQPTAPAFVQFNPDGSLDSTFGDDGISQPTLPFADNSHGTSLAITPDGKVDIVGGLDDPNGENILLARLDLGGVSPVSLPSESEASSSGTPASNPSDSGSSNSNAPTSAIVSRVLPGAPKLTQIPSIHHDDLFNGLTSGNEDLFQLKTSDALTGL
jgi:uncharacterized delta-60 repeat protein